MGDHWWLLVLGGGAMWAPLIWALVKGPPPADPCACPECGHETGLNGQHCDGQDDHNGWSSDLCKCQNDYHWNYESVTT